MSSEKKKQKRRNRAKMKMKKLNSGGRKKGERNLVPISVCPIHGLYTQKELCPCYDSNGMLHGIHTYQEDFENCTGVSVSELSKF